MSPPGVSSGGQYAAWVSLLSGLSEWPAFSYGAVPGVEGNEGTEPVKYLLVDVQRMAVAAPVSPLRTGWRVMVLAADTSPANVRLALDRVAAVVESRRVTLGGVSSTPIMHESTDGPERDGARFSGSSSWTYVM